jgi:hypothetical protein
VAQPSIQVLGLGLGIFGFPVKVINPKPKTLVFAI